MTPTIRWIERSPKLHEARATLPDGRDPYVGYVATDPGMGLGDDVWRGYVGRSFEPVGMGPRVAMQEAVVRRALEVLEDREETHGAYHCFS